LLTRFTGSVEAIGPVDVTAMADWISAIAFDAWPQQNKPGLPLKPAMVTDLGWHDFGIVCAPVVAAVMAHFPGFLVFQRMLSVVMPGNDIPAHVDQQAPYWLTRVHVPLRSDGSSDFVVDGRCHQLMVGTAYRVNTLAEHAVVNRGTAPRVHFMWDVRGG
jgi:hypothetical protein